MSNKINDTFNNLEIKLKKVDLNHERTLFEKELRKKNTKADINLHYDSITEDKLQGWESQLIESKKKFSNLNDCDILNEICKDRKIIRVIKDDLERTRILESIYMKSFKEYAYQIIIYFLRKNNIQYKQGLNEIVCPFVLLKYKFQLTISKIYILIESFIDKFLTNFYHEYDFYALKSCFPIISLLLKYHDPELYDKFDYYLITPDLFSTSWIMTFFANKFPLNIIYYLWDKLIVFNDKLFIFFFIVSILILNRETYFKVDPASILQVLSNFQITEIKQINEIINLAIQLRENTPKSLDLLADKLEIFKKDSKNLQKLYEQYQPDKMPAVPMFVEDIFSVTHEEIIGCPDENCKYFLKKSKNRINNSNCIFCNVKKTDRKQYYFVIDLRIINEIIVSNRLYNDLFSGTLPKTFKITNEQSLDENFPMNIINEIKNEKNKYHFIIITSDTNLFNEYENKFYVLQKLKNNREGVFYKRYKELNINLINEIFKEKNNKFFFSFKEYDNFKKLINGLNKEGFKYVSYAFGGYKQIHRWAIKNNVPLLGHGKQCILCREEEENKMNNSMFKYWQFS